MRDMVQMWTGRDQLVFLIEFLFDSRETTAPLASERLSPASRFELSLVSG
jgi:hypothetical protein